MPPTTETTELEASPAGDAANIIGIATAAAQSEELRPGVRNIVLPAGGASTILDLERFEDHPRRRHGNTEHHTAASLGAHVKDETGVPGTVSRLYADVYTRTIIGVLNGHDEATAGWGDHRGSLTLRHTAQWERWAAHDGKLLDQVTFAEHIEDRLDDITAPTGAEVLELAKTFQAKTGIEFESAIVLDSGQRQLTYKETIAARAGLTGQITIPKEIEIGLAPFEGSDPYRVRARLRYRLSGGNLTIGYQIVGLEDLLRAAFDDQLAIVENVTGLEAYRGNPPA